MSKNPRPKSPRGDREMDATEYLLRSPEDAKRLRESIQQIESGRGTFYEWPSMRPIRPSRRRKTNA